MQGRRRKDAGAKARTQAQGHMSEGARAHKRGREDAGATAQARGRENGGKGVHDQGRRCLAAALSIGRALIMTAINSG